MIPSQVNSSHQPNAERQRTLAASYYTSEAVLEQEKTDLYFKYWQFVGHVGELAEPGAFKTVSIFDQNIILTRTKENEIKAYYNVCPHRGAQLVDGKGSRRAFTCPYHAWTFGLDGELLTGRGTRSQSSFDSTKICLFEVKVDFLVGLIFINLDPESIPLKEFYPGLEEQMLAAAPEMDTYVPFYRNEEKEPYVSNWNANWKILIDNFLECYHCENAHPSFSKKMCIPDTVRNVHEHFTHEVTPISPEPSDWGHPIDLENDALESHFWYLFPSTAIGRASGVPNFYVSRFDPISPAETNRIITFIVPPGITEDKDAMERARLRSEAGAITGQEDQVLCESVQKGMSQIGFQEGWYITDPDAHNISEHALRYFHDLYLDAME